MCDTFGMINNNYAIFGKNSDRSPNEPQVIQFIKGHKNKNKKLKLTYIEIDEVEYSNTILISRPSWIWGAEMGVNEHGVVIGNEAIFTKGKYDKIGILGMDLVRLGLERSRSAEEAKNIIIELLKKYKQGGNCAYDHNFYYDNSFLIMDRDRIYILETSKDNYKIEEKDMWALSNCLSLKSDIIEDSLFKYFSGSKVRNEAVKNKLNFNIDVEDAFDILRTHTENNYLKKGSVKSPCMHAGGLVGDHTTSSLVIKLTDKIDVYFTATSLPCKSLFKHYKFGKPIDYPITNDVNTKYWYEQEAIKRSIANKTIPDSYIRERNKIEEKIIKNNIPLKEQLKLEKYLNNILLNNKENIKLGSYYKRYWLNKNKKLKESYND